MHLKAGVVGRNSFVHDTILDNSTEGVLCMPLPRTILVLLGVCIKCRPVVYLFLQTIRNEESLSICLRFFVNDFIESGGRGRVTMKSRFFWLSRQNSEFVSKRFLLLEGEVLISRSEEYDETRRDNDGQIGIGRIEHVTDTEFWILTAEAWSDFKVLIGIKCSRVLERFVNVFGGGDHCRGEV